jgi:hypothetical protein
MLASPIQSNAPEARRDLRISDADWLDLLYPWIDQQSNWWLEFRFSEDRPDDVKNPPVAVRFLREAQEIAAHLREHRALAASRAEELRRGQNRPWPAGLFWGVQPRVTRRSGRQRVAAIVALTVTLAAEDWTGWPAKDRPRVMWEALHGCPQPPSIVTWTGDGLEAWWLLREPLYDRRRGEEAQRALAGYFRAARPADAAGLCRWPNTLNYRRLPAGRPGLVRVVWWQPETRLSFQTLFEHFLPFAERPSARVSARDPGAVWRLFDQLLAKHEPLRALWSSHSGPTTADDRRTLNLALATMLAEHGLNRAEFATVAALARWNLEPASVIGELGRVYDELLKGETRASSVAGEETVSSFPAPAPSSALPETAWTEWARLYRRAVGSSTEAADEFHYLALLTVLATAFGRNVVLHCGRPIYPNMYTVLVGPTGDRKSTATQLAMELLGQVAPEALVLNGLGSQEGLMERMAQAEPGRHRSLLSVDELASFLKKARRESTGSLLEFVTEIFHCPDFKTHSTRSKAIHLKLPTLSILAGSTPVWLEAALQQEDILGGFANRFVYVTASPKPDNPLPARPDQQALADLVTWVRRATAAPPREIGWSPGARRLWYDFYVDWRRSSVEAGEQVVALLRRIDLYILKFASMAAAMEGTLEIAPAHLTSAIELGRFLAGCACRLLGDLGASSDCRLETLVHEKLEEAQGQMTRKQLRQALGGRISGEKLDRILTAMERNGLVSQALEPAARGKTRVVRLT